MWKIPSFRKQSGGNMHTFIGARAAQEANSVTYTFDDGHTSDHLPELTATETLEFEEAVLLLNIGGTNYRIRSITAFNRLKTSRLGQFAIMNKDEKSRNCDGYIEERKQWVFERSPKLFEAIFKFYCTGNLHRSSSTCLEEFMDELTFWEIPPSQISPCCIPRILLENVPKPAKDEFADLRFGRSRKELWEFCEGSGTVMSNAFQFVSVGFVLVSVLGLVVSSLPELQVRIDYPNVSNDTDDDIIPLPEWVPHPYFSIVESICIIWFTLEFLFRFIVSSDKFVFLRGFLNIIDILAIGPFYVEIILNIVGTDTSKLKNVKGALLVMRILRVLRVVRIFKLGRYSSGMRTFALTLRNSAKQLGMMCVVLSAGIVFFSTLMYFVEKDEQGTTFKSIPAGFWWSIVTMTTVGYGDVVPVTMLGKMIASCAILLGVLVLALPITIIVDNFMKVNK